MHAIRLGLTLLKFFPAEAMGGLKTIGSISEPFPQVRFVPTGGLQFENLTDYLRRKKIYAIGGSWMATRQTIHECRFDDIAPYPVKTSSKMDDSRKPAHRSCLQ
jgi:2-dehydro-3-deoxyphosphogluconate aldolase / (4S)-4-hydroxy-2-oxoglutarate aldolase